MHIMKCEIILDYLEQKYPLSYAEEWDNVGLLVGSREKEVHKVFLALDLTEELLEEAASFGADLILTHHPMIFRGMKRITADSSVGRKVLELIRRDISCYAMHTNYDVRAFAGDSGDRIRLKNQTVLSVTAGDGETAEGFGCVGDLEEEMTLRRYALRVKEWYGLSDVKIYGNPDTVIRRAAICTGAGKSFLEQARRAGADVYVTGDIDHHTGIDAVADGICVIDAGHYGTEAVFGEEMEKVLRHAFPKLEIRRERVRCPYILL